jgi:hypothetical protein
MSVILSNQSPTAQVFTYPANTSTLYTTGSLLYRDTTAGVVKEATASVGITTNIEAVGKKTFTSSATASLATIDATRLLGASQLWIVDCTNVTAANQLMKAQAMTDARTVANTSSAITTTLGVFVPLAIVGATTDKKLMGFFVSLGQVAA